MLARDEALQAPPRIAGPPPGPAIWSGWVPSFEVFRIWPGQIEGFHPQIAAPRLPRSSG
jgi:hypothetical protein